MDKQVYSYLLRSGKLRPLPACIREAVLLKLYTSAAIARTLGLNEQEVRALTKAGIIQKGFLPNRGLYRLEDTAREIIQNYRKPENERENADYVTERAKLMRIKRLNEQYSLELRKKELVRADELEIVLTKILVSFKSKLSSLPVKIAPQVAKMTDTIEIMDLIKNRVNEALEELSDFDSIMETRNGE